MDKLSNTFRWPVLKWRSIKSKVNDMNPNQKCRLVEKIAAAFLNPTGCAISDRNMKVTFRSFIPAFVILDVVFLTFYSAFYFRSNLPLALQPFIIFAIAVPISIPYASVFTRKNIFQNLLFFGTDYIYNFNSNDRDLNDILDNRSREFIKDAIKLFSVILLSLLACTVYPVIAFVFLHEYVLYANLILPYTNPYTVQGFYVNTGNLLLIAFIGVLASVGMELLNLIMTNNVQTGVKVVAHQFDKLDKELHADSTFTPDKRYHLRNILMLIQDLDVYVLNINEFYYWKFLVQPGLTTFGISVAIFCILSVEYKPGYGIAGFIYMQLLILCHMGSTVKTCNEDMRKALYSFSWYLLPTSEQKMLGYTLHRLQNSGVLTIGPLSELDHEMTAQLTNGIYKFTAMMKSFIE